MFLSTIHKDQKHVSIEKESKRNFQPKL